MIFTQNYKQIHIIYQRQNNIQCQINQVLMEDYLHTFQYLHLCRYELVQTDTNELRKLQIQSIVPQYSDDLDSQEKKIESKYLNTNILSKKKQEIKEKYQQCQQKQKFQRQVENIKLKCAVYIEKLRIELQEEQLQSGNNYSDFQACNINLKQDEKQIKKQKKLKKPNSSTNKHLLRLWSHRLMHFLKFYHTKYSISNQIFAKVRDSATREKNNVINLSKIFRENPWIYQIISKEEDYFLQYINLLKIHIKSKIMMFQTYTILKEGMRDPSNFKTLTINKKKNLDQTQRLYEICQGKQYKEICEILRQQYKNSQPDRKKTTKCSSLNNVTYHWNKYLKGIIESKHFQGIYHRAPWHKGLKEMILKPPSIENIKGILKRKEFAKYILEHKIYNKEIYFQILGNSRINLQNKYNMMISVENFTTALTNPQSLNGWFQ